MGNKKSRIRNVVQQEHIPGLHESATGIPEQSAPG